MHVLKQARASPNLFQDAGSRASALDKQAWPAVVRLCWIVWQTFRAATWGPSRLVNLGTLSGGQSHWPAVFRCAT
eukprot:365376-Chlamydomonas_euryale.AAC.9